MNDTLKYYNQNADVFIQGTLSVDFHQIQDRFAEKLNYGDIILDFGCGSGRDTKYFMEKGFKVDAIDGSEELCKRASRFTGISVKEMLFQDLDEIERYDGIWACSSILHLPKSELHSVLEKMNVALKAKGIIYTSFKYGDFEGVRNGRYFTDFTYETFQDYISNIQGMKMEEYWVTGDVRPKRETEKWLNLILRKQ